MTLVVRIGRKEYRVSDMARAVQLILTQSDDLEEYRAHGEGD